MRTWVKSVTLLCLFGLFFAPTARAQDKELIRPKSDAPTPPTPKPKIDHDAIEKLGFRLGVQAYTFRVLSAFETIDLIGDMGIRYIEFYPGQRLSPELPATVKLDHNMSAEHIESLKNKLKQRSVTAVNYGVVGLPRDEAESRKVFQWAKTMGLETIVSEPNEDAFDTIEKLCEEFQINVALHDHPYPSKYWYPQKVLEVAGKRSPRIGACADTGHWYRSGFLVTECVKKLKGRIISGHLKDLDENKRDIPWGQGKINAREVMAELNRQGTKVVFSIEYESSAGSELVANVAKTCENFSRLAVELAAEKSARN